MKTTHISIWKRDIPSIELWLWTLGSSKDTSPCAERSWKLTLISRPHSFLSSATENMVLTRFTGQSDTTVLHPKWHPIPYVVHYFSSGPIGLWSKVVHYIGIGCNLRFTLCPGPFPSPDLKISHITMTRLKELWAIFLIPQWLNIKENISQNLPLVCKWDQDGLQARGSIWGLLVRSALHNFHPSLLGWMNQSPRCVGPQL